jgi:hypothetical protein
MAITQQHEIPLRGAMKGLQLLVVGVALASLGRDASAELSVPDGSGRTPSLVGRAGPAHGGMTLAKAKKKGRRPAGASGGKSAPADDASGGDDDGAAGKSAAASSGGAGDDAKEDELLGDAPKKKKPAPPADEGSSSDEGGGGERKGSAKASSKSVETVESKASEEPSDASPISALEFGVGAKALFRQFNWTADARAAGLGPYTLSPGPETGLWLEFYPAAFGTSGFAANVGLFGRFDYGFGVATTLANGTNAATKFRDFLAGLKVRVPFGSVIPNASVAYGQQTFEIAPAGTPQDLPQLAYAFVRPALGTRVMFTPTVTLDVAAAYLMVLDPGSGAGHVRSTNFFPNATSLGFDVSASVGFRLTGAIGARGGIELRQYALNMNDKTTPTVAGAVDRYITAFVGVEVVLDGQGGAAGDDEPVKPSKRKRRHADPTPAPDDDSSAQSESEAE